MTNAKDLEPILYIYWYEVDRQAASAWLAQLAGGMHRLVALREEFEALRRMRDVEKALPRLELYLEVYLNRAYELQERARGFLARLTNRPPKKMCYPQPLDEALSQLFATDPILSSSLRNLLALLDDDREVRNQHTHESYFSLGFGEGTYDPYDALAELSDEPSELLKLRHLLLRGVRQKSEEYRDKSQKLITLARMVLEASRSRLLPGGGIA